MIVKMKKINLFLYHKERDGFLNSLKNAGVVHITENSDALSEKLTALTTSIKSISSILSNLKPNSKQEQKTDISPTDAIELFKTLKSAVDSDAQKIDELKKVIDDLTPWGEFDPGIIEKLSDNDISIRLFTLSAKKFEALDKTEMSIEIVNRIGQTIYFALVERGELKSEFGAERFIIPEKSLTSYTEELLEVKERFAQNSQKLEDAGAYYTLIDNYYKKELSEKEYEVASLSFSDEVDGKVVVLTGWYPEEVEKQVTDCVDSFTVWYELSEPSSEDTVPVKLKNKKGFNFFEPLTKIFALPDYFEIDPTPFFAPFYALFFGLCLGDLGYGAILTLVSIVAIFKLPKNMKPIMTLALFLGIATMLSGLMLNTVFGAPIFGNLKSGVFSLAMLSPRSDLSGVFPAMSFSLYLGLVQVILGMALKSINRFRDGGITYSLYPIGTIFLVIAVGLSLIKIDFLDMAYFWEVAFPGLFKKADILSAITWTLVKIIGGVGLVLLFLFNNPEKKIVARLPLGLWELYNFVTGIMGDGLSYIRLFALGLAGGLLGAAFNQIAFMLITDNGGTVHYNSVFVLFTILILVLGHTINFALAAIGSFVHPLRLTFVEFYNNLEFKGGAKPFKPFSRIINN